MITLFVMPNMKGTIQDKLTALLYCTLLDAFYIMPLIVF